jgi:hypothetical protein
MRPVARRTAAPGRAAGPGLGGGRLAPRRGAGGARGGALLALALAPRPLGDTSRGVIAGMVAEALILAMALALRAGLPRTCAG